MRIAHVCPRYYPDIGGVETVVQEICERLVKMNHDVDVITTDPTGKLPETEVINDVTIYRFKSFAPNNAYFIAPQITSFLKMWKYDVIHIHSYHALPALFGTLGRNGAKIVFSPYYHGAGHTPFRDILFKAYKLLGQYAIKKADSIICLTKHEKHMLERDFGEMNKIEIIPPGINFAELSSVEYKPIPNSLLYVGRFEEYKGIQYIIKALVQLPEWHLTIVGNGSYCEELYELALKYHVANRILWKDRISREELLNIYASTSMFIMLSSKESYGIAVAEALAIGIPCILNGNSALQEFAYNKNCITLYGNFEKELPRAIKILDIWFNKLTNEHNNTSIAINIWDWNKIIEKITNIYMK